jgi:hypothetical protein
VRNHSKPCVETACVFQHLLFGRLGTEKELPIWELCVGVGVGDQNTERAFGRLDAWPHFSTSSVLGLSSLLRGVACLSC